MNMPAIQEEQQSLMPSTFRELQDFSKTVCNSSFCPAAFKGKPADVLVAIQMGYEVGLKPIQALQNIAVINGKPSIYGDAVLALVQAHPDFEWIKEEYIESIKGFRCIIKRRGYPETIRDFTQEDAIAAGLWGKQGPWKNYPKRMLQMRARGFCARDSFADALKGLITAEEASDYPSKPKTKEKYMGTLDASNDQIINDAEVEVIKEVEEKYFATHEQVKELVSLLDTLPFEEGLKLREKWMKAKGIKTLHELETEWAQKCIDFVKGKLEKYVTEE